MNTKKLELYKQAIWASIQLIHEKNEDFKISDVINQRLNQTTFKVKYDSEFCKSLNKTLQNLEWQDTVGKEEVLDKLLEKCTYEHLILDDEYDYLSKQILILKRLRRIYSTFKKDSSKMLSCLEEEYGEGEEQKDGDLVQKFLDDRSILRMKLEDEIKRFTPELRQLNDESQIFQIQQQQAQPRQFSNLDNYLEQVYQSQALKPDQMERLMKEVSFIREAVQQMNLKQLLGLEYVTVQPYGSIVSGFAQKTSDADVSINTNCYLNEIEFIDLIANFIETYSRQKQLKVNIKKVTSAKTPVIQYQREDDQGKIEIDISINNVLGCTNSRMLSVLAQIDPIIPKLGIVIKAWAKANKISSKDHLSSYSFILMMLYFMFREKILNSTFKEDRKQNMNKDVKNTVSIRRIRNANTEEFQTNLYFTTKVEYLKQKNQESCNRSQRKNINEYTLSELFTKFINFYFSACQNEQKRLISVFNFDYEVQHNFSYKLFNPEYYFNIEDPFDDLHNPGEKSKKNNSIYKQAFEDAKNYIQQNQFELLFPK